MGTGKKMEDSGRKRKLTNKDRRGFKRIVGRKHKKSLSEITYEMNGHHQNFVSAKTIKRELHNANIYRRVSIRRLLVTSRIVFKRRQWCRAHRRWTIQQWQQVIYSDESAFILFQTTGLFYIWRTPREAFKPSCRL